MLQECWLWATGLMRNHGPFAWGPSGAKSVENALALEIVADMAFHALTLNPSAQSPSLALSERHFHRKHGPTATYGQS
jgi:L-ribulose-5-phosphate 4-epimerase